MPPYIAAEKKVYSPDFWKEGVCLAHAHTDDITTLATVVDFWLCNDITTKELAQKFVFVKPSDKASAFDENQQSKEQRKICKWR